MEPMQSNTEGSAFVATRGIERYVARRGIKGLKTLNVFFRDFAYRLQMWSICCMTSACNRSDLSFLALIN